MNLEAISRTIQQHIADNWVLTPYSYEGIPHKNMALAGQPLLQDGSDPYVIFEIIHEDAEVITVPLSCVRHTGFISAAVYVPENTGLRQANAIQDQLNVLLRYKTLTGNLRIKEFLSSGRFEAPEWTILACQWPFEAEDQV